MKIFVICPHTDDGEIGAGGATARFLEEGAEVHYVVLSVPLPELEEECVHAVNSLKTEKNGIHLHIHRFQARRFSEHRQDSLQTIY